MDTATLLKPLFAWSETALDLLWPPQCAACGRAVEKEMLCLRCLEHLPFIASPRCEACSQPFAGGGTEFICESCKGRQFHFVASLSPLMAHGAIRVMIHRFKYRKERWLARPLAHWMESLKNDSRLDLQQIAGLVPVPLHARRERKRGYNQALLLAQALGKLWGKPVFPILRRERYTETQTHFDRTRRMQNLHNAFGLIHNTKIQSMKFLLIDDVFTTGSTLDECARTLLDRGAGAIWAATAARA